MRLGELCETLEDWPDAIRAYMTITTAYSTPQIEMRCFHYCNLALAYKSAYFCAPHSKAGRIKQALLNYQKGLDGTDGKMHTLEFADSAGPADAGSLRLC